MKLFPVFLASFIMFFHFSVSADDALLITETEAKFQEIGFRWLQFEERASKEGLAPEWIAVQLKKIREDFKKFAKENFESPWADEAYFFAAALESQREKSLEAKVFIIENYPDASAEEWTRNSLSFALPEIEPLDAGIRLDVCLEYLKTGKTRELEMLAIDSAQKYPELGTQFEILVLEPQVPKTNHSH